MRNRQDSEQWVRCAAILCKTKQNKKSKSKKLVKTKEEMGRGGDRITSLLV